jgi:thioredoxin reductase (NADPH)
MYDIIVIGAGPAGLSAAITARARDKKVLVISNKPQESPLAKARRIDNYPGLPRIDGLRMLKLMLAHARDMQVKFVFERAISILSTGEHFTVATGDRNFETRSVILATGAYLDKAFKGEEEFLGRGVSYCATCDGMLHRTQSVCVVGLSAEAIDEANFLARIGAKVVFLSKWKPVGIDENIEVKRGVLVEIKGDATGVFELRYREYRENTGDGPAGAPADASASDANASTDAGSQVDNPNDSEASDVQADPDNIPASTTKSIPCTGVFILRSAITPDVLMAGLELIDGSVAVDHVMGTNKPGLFAAGDCVGNPLQVAAAVGEGQRACFSAVKYIDQNRANRE